MPKELLKVSTTLRGKMKGMTVITSSCTDNPHCKKLSKIEGAICTHCYAQRGLSYMRGPREAYVKNGKILSSGIIPRDELPFINASFCRLESHGDLINETHLQNYVNLCKKNSHCKFSLWTKVYDLVYDYFKTHKAPRNLTVIFSSLMVNQQMNIERYKALGLKCKVFTVYDKQYLKTHPEVNINCGARSCITCAKCYTSKEEVINEIQK